MKKIKSNSIFLLIALSVTINFAWAESSDLLYLEGQNLFHESRYDAGKLELALEKVNKAISLDPNDVNYFSLLGSIQLLLGEYDNAIENYKKALKIEPENPSLITQIGDVKAFQNNYDAALLLYDKAILLDEKNWRTYQNRGYIFYLQNKHLLALEDFNEAIKLNSKALYAYNNRGKLQYEMENYDSALADFKKAGSLDPNSPIPSFYQGQYLEKKGDIVAAAEKYKLAINISKKLPMYPTYPQAQNAFDRVSALLKEKGSVTNKNY